MRVRMGGYGSGRHAYSQKQKISSYHPLDIRRWQREGLLKPWQYFNWQWTQNGELVAAIAVRTEPARVFLVYRHRRNGEAWQSANYPVSIEWTKCHYGGLRAWFRCPAMGCGRRVAILYMGSIFACRHCYRLGYDSQLLSASDRDLNNARAIRMRLGGTMNLCEPYPDKPTGMHWRTYLRLCRKGTATELRWLSQAIR